METRHYKKVSIEKVKIRMDLDKDIFFNNWKKIISSKAIHELSKIIYEKEGHDINVSEMFIALYLDRASKIIAYYVISVGGVVATVVDSRLIYAAAINCLASSIILVHNHPSENLQPSNHDISIKKEIKIIGDIHKIQLLDFVIITTDAHYSFADEGIL